MTTDSTTYTDNQVQDKNTERRTQVAHDFEAAPVDRAQRYEVPEIHKINHIVAHRRRHRDGTINQQIVRRLDEQEQGKGRQHADDDAANRDKLEILYGLVKPLHA